MRRLISNPLKGVLAGLPLKVRSHHLAVAFAELRVDSLVPGDRLCNAHKGDPTQQVFIASFCGWLMPNYARVYTWVSASRSRGICTTEPRQDVLASNL